MPNLSYPIPHIFIALKISESNTNYEAPQCSVSSPLQTPVPHPTHTHTNIFLSTLFSKTPRSDRPSFTPKQVAKLCLCVAVVHSTLSTTAAGTPSVRPSIASSRTPQQTAVTKVRIKTVARNSYTEISTKDTCCHDTLPRVDRRHLLLLLSD